MRLKSLNLYEYIETYCEGNLNEWKTDDTAWFMYIEANDFTSTTMQIYFLYKKALSDDDVLLAHAYYKTFFDRITTELVFKFKLNENDLEATGPNYRNYYRARDFRSVYSDYENSEETIATAHKMRNSNPIVHSSAEAITTDSVIYTRNEFLKSINDLEKLVTELIEDNYF